MKKTFNSALLVALLTLPACLVTTTSSSEVIVTTLSNLTLSSGTLTPTFSSSTLTYAASVSDSSITITPTSTNASVKIQVNSEVVASGSASSPISLVLGSNPITIAVTASGGWEKDYIVVVDRKQTKVVASPTPSNDSYLSSIILSNGSLSPSLSHTKTSYTASVGNRVTSIGISAAAEIAAATLTINDTQVDSGDQATFDLVVGPNVIQILVKAPSGDERSYSLIVTRAAPDINYFENTPNKGYTMCDPYGNIQISTDPNYFFMLAAPDGSQIYVRQTLQLKLNEYGQLVDKYNGYSLEPQITLPVEMIGLNITPLGVIEVTTPGSSNPNVYGQLQVVSFMNPDALQQIAGPDGAMVQTLQQANLSMLSSISSGSRINSADDSNPNEGSYYVQTDDSGSPNTSSPDGSFFGTAISYCGKLSVPEFGSVKLTIKVNGKGLLQLQQQNGTLAYYINSSEFSIVNDANGNLLETTTGLPITPGITVPSDVLIETLSVDETGAFTVAYPNGSILNLGQIQLAIFQNPDGLMQSAFNPNVFQTTPNSGLATTGNPGDNGVGPLSMENSEVAAPTIVPAMEVHTPTYSYQSTSSNICADGNMTIEITDLTHYFKFNDANTGTPYYKRGQQQIVRDPATGLLVDVNGYVLDPGITIPQDATKVLILPNGAVQFYVQGSVQPSQAGNVIIYSAPNGFDMVQGMDGYYVEIAQPIASAATGGFTDGSIAFCGGRVLEDQQNTMINDMMTINMEILGSCFFQLTDFDGTSAYTRNNKFIVDATGVIREFTSGLTLQPTITIPSNAVSVSITSDGIVNVTLDNSTTEQVGQISLSKFMSVSGLSKSAENYSILKESSHSGTPTQTPAGQYGCGTIIFGSFGIRSDFNSTADIFFTPEQTNLQKLDDALAAFAPLQQSDQQVLQLLQ